MSFFKVTGASRRQIMCFTLGAELRDRRRAGSVLPTLRDTELR